MNSNTLLPSPSELLANSGHVWPEDLRCLADALKSWQPGRSVLFNLYGIDTPPEALIKALAARGWDAKLQPCAMDPAPSLLIQATPRTTR